jgi:outer membrane protein
MTKGFWDIAVKGLLGASVLVLFILHMQQTPALVYVDAQKLVIGYKGMQAARAEFEAKAQAWKANLDTLNMELEQRVRDFEASKGSLSPRERKLTEELIRSKQEQFVSYQQAIQEKVQKEDQELSKKVMDELNAYIKKYGEKNGYSIILAATQYGNIAYAEKGMDVTEEVLKGINNAYR